MSIPAHGGAYDPIVVVSKTTAWAPVATACRRSLVPEDIPFVYPGDVRPLEAPELFRKVQYNYGRGRGNAFVLPSLDDDADASDFTDLWGFEPGSSTSSTRPSEVSFSSTSTTAFSIPRRAVVEPEPVDAPPRPLAELLEQLDGMVGLASVKAHVRRLVAFEEACRRRREAGFETPPISHHLALLGPAGTGKTTLARLMAEIYHAVGVTRKSTLVEVDRSTLVGEVIGDTARRTRRQVERAMGGTLFVDEAYSLAGGGRDFGAEAISTLVKLMEDRRGEFVLIVAGYEEAMRSLWETNAGLEGRFPRRNRIRFEAYSPAELAEIARACAGAMHYRLTDEAVERFVELAGPTVGTPRFANGRWARDVVEDAMLNQAVRIGAGADDLVSLLAEDLPDAVEGPSRTVGFTTD